METSTLSLFLAHAAKLLSDSVTRHAKKKPGGAQCLNGALPNRCWRRRAVDVPPLPLGPACFGARRFRAEAGHLREGLHCPSKGRAVPSGHGEGMRPLNLNPLSLPLAPALVSRRESFATTFPLPLFARQVRVEERKPCLFPAGEHPLLLLQSPLPDSLNNPKRSKGQRSGRRTMRRLCRVPLIPRRAVRATFICTAWVMLRTKLTFIVVQIPRWCAVRFLHRFLARLGQRHGPVSHAAGRKGLQTYLGGNPGGLGLDVLGNLAWCPLGRCLMRPSLLKQAPARRLPEEVLSRAAWSSARSELLEKSRLAWHVTTHRVGQGRTAVTKASCIHGQIWAGTSWQWS